MKVLVRLQVRMGHVVEIPDDLWKEYQEEQKAGWPNEDVVKTATDQVYDLISEGTPTISGWDSYDVDEEEYIELNEDGTVKVKEVQS